MFDSPILPSRGKLRLFRNRHPSDISTIPRSKHLRPVSKIISTIALVLGLALTLAVSGTAGEQNQSAGKLGRIDPRHPRRYFTAPARWGDEEVTCLRAGGAPARCGEYIAPHVEHWQQIIATRRIWRGYDHRLCRHIKKGA